MILHSFGQCAILAKAFALAATTIILLQLLPKSQSAVFIRNPSHHQGEQGPQFHVVASHYGADPKGLDEWIAGFRTIPYIQELGLKVTIYSKDRKVNLTHLQSVTGADEVLRRPNIGRESETYLHHILQNYDTLPRFTFFTQAEPVVQFGRPAGFDLEHHRFLKSQFKNATGFMNLGYPHPNPHLKCDCGKCATGYYPLLPQLHAMITREVCYTPPGSDGQTIHIWGQFIASRDRIRERPRHIYEYLHRLISAPRGHWIHDEQEPAEPLRNLVHESEPSNPLFGHTLERLWPTLFGCADETTEGCEITVRDEASIEDVQNGQEENSDVEGARDGNGEKEAEGVDIKEANDKPSNEEDGSVDDTHEAI